MKRFRSQAKNQYLNRNLRRSHTEPEVQAEMDKGDKKERSHRDIARTPLYEKQGQQEERWEQTEQKGYMHR